MRAVVPARMLYSYIYSLSKVGYCGPVVSLFLQQPCASDACLEISTLGIWGL